MTEPTKVPDIQEQLKNLMADASDPSAPVDREHLVRVLDKVAMCIAELKAQVVASQERVDRLERRQNALIDHVEEVEDKLEIHLGDEEEARTGEKPVPWEQVKEELDL